MQPDWLRQFRPISQEQKIPQIWDLCRNTAYNISFHYRTNSSFNKFKNSVFGPFCKILGQKIFRKSGSIMQNLTWAFSTMPKFRKKTNDTIPRKRLDRKMEGEPTLWDTSSYRQGSS